MRAGVQAAVQAAPAVVLFTCQTANAMLPGQLEFSGAGLALFPFSFSLADEGNGAPGGAGVLGDTPTGLARARRAPRCGARTPD